MLFLYLVSKTTWITKWRRSSRRHWFKAYGSLGICTYVHRYVCTYIRTYMQVAAPALLILLEIRDAREACVVLALLMPPLGTFYGSLIRRNHLGNDVVLSQTVILLRACIVLSTKIKRSRRLGLVVLFRKRKTLSLVVWCVDFHPTDFSHSSKARPSFLSTAFILTDPFDTIRTPFA